MLEMLINPREAEKKPSRLFFVGLLYAALSLLLVDLIFLRSATLAKHAPLLVITFSVMFSLPFMYSLIRRQEFKEVTEGQNKTLFREHFTAIISLLWLFLGFVVAFSFFYIVLPSSTVTANFGSQVEEFCRVNMPQQVSECLRQYGIKSSITGQVIGGNDVAAIFLNNIFVLIFVLIFSLAFGAGAIFILAWNASVIGAAIGLLFKSSLNFGLFFTYLIHGLPEIAAYFVAALAGGILSMAIIRQDFGYGKFKGLLTDFFNLTLLAIVLLFVAALLEVYVSPYFF